MATQPVRVAEYTEAEGAAINALSFEERRAALVAAGQIKLRQMDQQLMNDYLQRVLRGEIEPDTSFPTRGEVYYYQNEREPLQDVGRVPGHTGLHVLRRGDGSLLVAGGYNLRRHGEVWEDFLEQSE